MNGDLDLQQQLTLFTIQCILFSSPNPSFISFSSNEAHSRKKKHFFGHEKYIDVDRIQTSDLSFV